MRQSVDKRSMSEPKAIPRLALIDPGGEQKKVHMAEAVRALPWSYSH
jgi:hypothetical protein